MNRETTCTFTGHRPPALPWGDNECDPRCLEVKERLRVAVEAAYEEGYRHYVCGMALGADFYFCEAVIDLRRTHPDVILEAAVPYPGQCEQWSPREQRRYWSLLDQCDMETMVQKEYSSTCMFRRNMYMVDHSSLVIAIFNGSPASGGTLSTLNYAMNSGVRTEILSI